MGRKRITHAGMLVALACFSGCFQMNTSSTTEQDNDPTAETCSTAVLGTIPPYVNIQFDDTSFYFYDSENSRICKMDKNTGVVKTLNNSTGARFRNLCMDDKYLYGYEGSFISTSIYRIDKSLNSSPELIVNLDRKFFHIEAGGNKLYLDVELAPASGVNKRGLVKYDISEGTMVEISNQNFWYGTDREYVYWITYDSLSKERILWKMPHSSSIPLILAKGDLWDGKMLSEYIYCWDQDPNLLRISTQTGIIEKIISAPVGFDEDDGYVIRDEFVFVTNSYEATLRVFNLRNPQKGFTILDKRGGFDDDDMVCWLWADKNALYWVAGPEKGSRISDEQWGTLFKTVVNKEALSQ